MSPQVCQRIRVAIRILMAYKPEDEPELRRAAISDEERGLPISQLARKVIERERLLVNSKPELSHD